MPRSVRLAAVVAGLACACTGASPDVSGQPSPVAGGQDRVALPSIRRDVRSPSGSHLLIISADDGWRTPKASGELLRVTAGRTAQVWKRALPEPFGPRFGLVNDAGSTLLVDEWVNTITPHALVLLDVEGSERAHYTFADVEKATGVEGSAIVRMARYGSWLSSVPELDRSGNRVSFGVGGKVLAIDLADGHLSAIR